MMVSVILVNYNGAHHLRKCLNSLFSFTEGVPLEVIVVDNASTDGSSEVVRKEFPNVHLIECGENVGFSRGNNIGVAQASGEYLLFLNTDTYLIENSVRIMASFLQKNKTVGALGPKLVFETGHFQLSSGKSPSIAVELTDKIIYSLDRKWRNVLAPAYERLFGHARKVGWLTGACLMVRREVFRKIGGFDEQIFMYYEDKDLCKRIRSVGWALVYFPETSVVHILGGSAVGVSPSTIRKHYRASQLYYYRKHLGKLQLSVVQGYLKISGKLK